MDPGEKFPWEVLSKKGVAKWYSKYKSKNMITILHRKEKFFLKIFLK